MRPESVTCPSCGAPFPSANPGVLMAVCEYCGNAIRYDDAGIADMGQQAVLSEGFTRLYRNAWGTLAGKRFEVLGRVRYGFPRGFWDEWYVRFEDGDTAWVTEDDHELALEVAASGGVPPFTALRPGADIEYDGQTYRVDEVGHATCLGVEGQLPKTVESDESYRYADLSSLDGTHSLAIEYDDEPPTVFVGRWLDPAEIELDDEGVEW